MTIYCFRFLGVLWNGLILCIVVATAGFFALSYDKNLIVSIFFLLAFILFLAGAFYSFIGRYVVAVDAETRELCIRLYILCFRVHEKRIAVSSIDSIECIESKTLKFNKYDVLRKIYAIQMFGEYVYYGSTTAFYIVRNDKLPRYQKIFEAFVAYPKLFKLKSFIDSQLDFIKQDRST